MLDIGAWNFIWSVINVALLFILLKIFLFKPINRIMEERTNAIQSDIDAAEKSKEEAEALKEEYEKSLENAKSEAQQILIRAREEAVSAKQDILRDSESQAKQLIDSANKAIENERRKAMHQAQNQIADLAIAAASKIIGENMDDEKNRRLVDDFLAEEGALNNDSRI